MPVDTPHQEWTDLNITWKTIRDVVGGERFIKGAGDTYLEVLREQDPRSYERYKNRALWFGGTSRTVEGLHGLIFRKPPVITRPKTATFNSIWEDCTMDGVTWINYCTDVVRETLTVGRCGSLIDFSKEENRPFVCRYDAENVLNWKVTRINGKMMLSQLVLFEYDPQWINLNDGEERPDEFDTTKYEQWRVYRLIPAPENTVFCTCTVYRKKKKKNQKPNRAAGEDDEFVVVGESIPDRRGKTLDFIPFVFHGANNNQPECNKPPMEDLANVNLSLYRTSADLENGLHMSGMPTPWAAGFELKGEDDELFIGSTTAWVTDNAEAKCGYLEVASEFNALRTSIKDKIEMMATMGARLLEPQKTQTEAAETHKIRQAGESATLVNISQSGSASLTQVLQMLQWWIDTAASPQDITDKQVDVDLNEDFIDNTLDAMTLQQLVAAWMNHAISYESLFDRLQDGEIIPPDRTIEEERASIQTDAVMAPALPGNQQMNQPPSTTPGQNNNGGQGGSGGGDGTGDEPDPTLGGGQNRSVPQPTPTNKSVGQFNNNDP